MNLSDLYRSNRNNQICTGTYDNVKDNNCYVSDIVYTKLVKLYIELLSQHRMLVNIDYSRLSHSTQHTIFDLDKMNSITLEYLSNVIAYNKLCRIFGVTKILDYKDIPTIDSNIDDYNVLSE